MYNNNNELDRNFNKYGLTFDVYCTMWIHEIEYWPRNVCQTDQFAASSFE